MNYSFLEISHLPILCSMEILRLSSYSENIRRYLLLKKLKLFLAIMRKQTDIDCLVKIVHCVIVVEKYKGQ